MNHNNSTIKKVTHNNTKVKKWYHDNVRVFTSGNIVTYKVDTNTVYTEEVDSDATCLAPKTFTPSKSGWTFVGWRSNSAANTSVYSSLNMGDNPITLYAVFKNNISLSVYNGSASRTSQYGDRIYNNGNVVNPKFSVTPASLSGWVFDGWASSSGAAAGITHTSISNLEITTNTVYYGRYSQTIYLYYNGNGATAGGVATQSGTRYFNSGNFSNPSFTLSTNQYGRENYLFNGWEVNGGLQSAGAALTLTSSATAYASWVKMSWSYVNGTPGIYAVQVPYSARYKIKACGAQGGSTGAHYRALPNGQAVSPGGLGGYSEGTIFLNAGTVLYMCVGGHPGDSSATGGYNGGGNALVTNSSGSASAGGGATHIATANGLLKDLASNSGAVLLVAGGGGGASFTESGDWAVYAPGGSGGGTNGGDSGAASGGLEWNTDADGDYVNMHGQGLPASGGGRGGTQSAGGVGEDGLPHRNGSFGQGGDGSDFAYRAGGGGGGWFGGSAGFNAGAGAGGSGYLNPSLASTQMLNGHQVGNGYAEISIL